MDPYSDLLSFIVFLDDFGTPYFEDPVCFLLYRLLSGNARLLPGRPEDMVDLSPSARSAMSGSARQLPSFQEWQPSSPPSSSSGAVQSHPSLPWLYRSFGSLLGSMDRAEATTTQGASAAPGTHRCISMHIDESIDSSETEYYSLGSINPAAADASRFVEALDLAVNPRQSEWRYSHGHCTPSLPPL